MPNTRAFCLREPSDLFISLEILATGVRALECALSSFTSSFVYSLRLFFVFLATRCSGFVETQRLSTANPSFKWTDSKVPDAVEISVRSRLIAAAFHCCAAGPQGVRTLHAACRIACAADAI